MRLAGFHEGEDGHQEREGNERAVAENRFDCQGLWCSEAATIDLHSESVRAYDSNEEPQHD
jgi:hypothetical protein